MVIQYYRIGDPCVGKTALTQAFHSDGTHFPKNYTMVSSVVQYKLNKLFQFMWLQMTDIPQKQSKLLGHYQV